MNNTAHISTKLYSIQGANYQIELTENGRYSVGGCENGCTREYASQSTLVEAIAALPKLDGRAIYLHTPAKRWTLIGFAA